MWPRREFLHTLARKSPTMQASVGYDSALPKAYLCLLRQTSHGLQLWSERIHAQSRSVRDKRIGVLFHSKPRHEMRTMNWQSRCPIIRVKGLSGNVMGASPEAWFSISQGERQSECCILYLKRIWSSGSGTSRQVSNFTFSSVVRASLYGRGSRRFKSCNVYLSLDDIQKTQSPLRYHVKGA